MVEIAERVGPGRIDIAYETFGSPVNPALVLIMGLGTQMLGWPDDLCDRLAHADLFVIRFDNRDVGLSTHLHHAPPVDLLAASGGDVSTAPYTLTDMAGDAVGLMDALGVEAAHIVGASMGGMIAQTMALEHPERALTLTSIMSTTGDPTVGRATDRANAAVLAPPATNREEAVARALSIVRVIGTPGEVDEAEVAHRAGLSFDRAFDPEGVGRQLMAIIASGDRTARLPEVTCPTLVMHGSHDQLVDASGGRATAEAIPNATFSLLEGMGHDLPPKRRPEIADRILSHVDRGLQPALT